jgi:2-oxoglutarate dehydrogenase E1 component
MALSAAKAGLPPFGVFSRAASASPATGSAKRHAQEQSDLIKRAVSL